MSTTRLPHKVIFVIAIGERFRGGAPSDMGLPDRLPGNTENVGEDRPGDSRGGKVVDLAVDLHLDLPPGLHQLLKASESFTTGHERLLPRRR
ncbi:MAG TPA: hypothetical protein VNQ53_08210 [Nocardioides sp.]|nr:hypothetical protein [Nocardioides sp.]